MKSLVYSELRKLLFTRSTYAILSIIVVLLVGMSFLIQGLHADISSLQNHYTVRDNIIGIANFVGILSSLIGLFLMAYEYRYNTATYTLIAANKRWKAFAAKILALLGFTIVVTIISCALSTALFYIGVGLSSNPYALASQNIPYLSLIWRSLLFACSYALIGLIIAELVRGMVGAVAFLLLYPTSGEALLSLFLKDHSSYLPFGALTALIEPDKILSPARAALIVFGYLFVFGVLAYASFTRRDTSS